EGSRDPRLRVRRCRPGRSSWCRGRCRSSYSYSLRCDASNTPGSVRKPTDMWHAECNRNCGGKIMSFAIYALGCVILVIGLSIGAHLMHMPPRWIAVLDCAIIGLGIMSGVKATRHRDPS